MLQQLRDIGLQGLGFAIAGYALGSANSLLKRTIILNPAHAALAGLGIMLAEKALKPICIQVSLQHNPIFTYAAATLLVVKIMQCAGCITAVPTPISILIGGIGILAALSTRDSVTHTPPLRIASPAPQPLPITVTPIMLANHFKDHDTLEIGANTTIVFENIEPELFQQLRNGIVTNDNLDPILLTILNKIFKESLFAVGKHQRDIDLRNCAIAVSTSSNKFSLSLYAPFKVTAGRCSHLLTNIPSLCNLMIRHQQRQLPLVEGQQIDLILSQAEYDTIRNGDSLSEWKDYIQQHTPTNYHLEIKGLIDMKLNIKNNEPRMTLKATRNGLSIILTSITPT